MSGRDLDEAAAMPRLVPGGSTALPFPVGSVLVGQLVGFKDMRPLVVYPGQPGTAAIEARATLDLQTEHIGRDVVLTFEAGDGLRPIVIGCLREPSAWPLTERPAQVEVNADGQRLVVDAKEQIVLRCGKASITLSRAGKVLIRGTYVCSDAEGLNRVRGGAIQLN